MRLPYCAATRARVVCGGPTSAAAGSLVGRSGAGGRRRSARPPGRRRANCRPRPAEHAQRSTSRLRAVDPRRPLRPFDAQDAPLIARIIDDPDVRKYTGGAHLTFRQHDLEARNAAREAFSKAHMLPRTCARRCRKSSSSRTDRVRQLMSGALNWPRGTGPAGLLSRFRPDCSATFRSGK